MPKIPPSKKVMLTTANGTLCNSKLPLLQCVINPTVSTLGRNTLSNLAVAAQNRFIQLSRSCPIPLYPTYRTEELTVFNVYVTRF